MHKERNNLKVSFTIKKILERVVAVPFYEKSEFKN